MDNVNISWRRMVTRFTGRLLLVVLGMALVLGLVLTACAPDQPAPTDQPAPAGNAFVDDLGRMVTIEETPRRIVSLSPANTEILFALGLGEKVVGVTNFCDYPAEAMDNESVGDFYPPDIEKIVALDPDLIVATDIHRHDVIPALEDKGFTVFGLAPQTLQEILECFHKLGEITGEEEAALQLVKEMERKIEEVQEKAAAIEDTPRVLYVTWHDPLWTVGRNTWIDDLITIAGGVNIFSAYFESGAMVEVEWAIFLNPEVIIAGSWSYDWANDATELEGTDARLNGHVYPSDDNLVQRSSPRLVEALAWFAHFIHPEVFEEPAG